MRKATLTVFAALLFSAMVNAQSGGPPPPPPDGPHGFHGAGGPGPFGFGMHPWKVVTGADEGHRTRDLREPLQV